MNNYTTPNYPSMDMMQPGFQQPFPFQQVPYTGQISTTFYRPNATSSPTFIEQSYIENILRLNRGKVATIYMNFENSQWGSKIFRGVIEAAGKDHIIISDPATNMRYLLLTIYLNYITFDEEINYEYPFANSLFRTKDSDKG